MAFVKRDCPTCVLVEPALAQLAGKVALTVYSQDDPGFPAGTEPRDDRSLAASWHHGIEVVPTLLRVRNGEEVGRAIGWHRGEWEALTEVSGLAPELPDQRPGCGSLSVNPDRAHELLVRFGGSKLASRRVELAAKEDEFEAAYARGWSDGLPVVPPTEERVLAML